MIRPKIHMVFAAVRSYARQAWPVILAKARILFFGSRDLIRTLWSGWIHVARVCFEFLKTLVQGLPVAQLAFLIVCLLLIVVSMLSWTTFQIDLTGLERVGVGSSFRFLFVLPGTFGLFFAFVDVPYKRAIFAGAVVVCLLVYALGFLFPNPIHTAMLKPDDYRFAIPAFVYGPLLALAFFLSAGGFAQPILDPRDLVDRALHTER